MVRRIKTIRIRNGGILMAKVKYNEGQPCEHTGCLNHLTHPCEGCGRIGGKGIIYELEQLDFPCTICCKPIPAGTEYFSVMNRGGDFDPCCSMECAEKQKEK